MSAATGARRQLCPRNAGSEEETMHEKRIGAVALRSLALLVFVAAYGAGTESCLTALWSFARMTGANWLFR